MTDFVGDPAMVALQKQILQNRKEIDADPLRCNGGRLMQFLDPDRTGWDVIKAEAERYGMVGLLMVDPDRAKAGARATFGSDIALPQWAIYVATSDAATKASSAVIASHHLPQGWAVTTTANPDPDLITDCQELNLRCGVAPPPGYYLGGQHYASALTTLHDATGTLAACAFAVDRHHPKGRLARDAFAGSVSVAPAHRGMGLGALTFAHLLHDGQPLIGCTRFHAGAKPDNAPSIRMIASAGLTHDPSRAIIVVNLTGGYITR